MPLTGPRLGEGSLHSAECRLMANGSTLEAKQSEGRITASTTPLQPTCSASSCNSGASRAVSVQAHQPLHLSTGDQLMSSCARMKAAAEVQVYHYLPPGVHA